MTKSGTKEYRIEQCRIAVEGGSNAYKNGYIRYVRHIGTDDYEIDRFFHLLKDAIDVTNLIPVNGPHNQRIIGTPVITITIDYNYEDM